jgi:5-bromo-4-chloroindolyl phosphate hydrolysis protein
MISNLSDKDLTETYLKAIEMGLEKDFIAILEDEIKRRGIEIEIEE